MARVRLPPKRQLHLTGASVLKEGGAISDMAILDPRELQNEQWIEEEDQLRFFAAAKAVVTAGSYDAEYQLCQIVFMRSDGSILITTPYLGEAPGLLAEVSIAEDATPPYELSLAEKGKLTSHLVKYSHHPDGRVHFSQSGKIKTEVVRPSFRLGDEIGHLFDLHIYHPWGFEPFSLQARKQDRVYLRSRFSGNLPEAVIVSAQWRRKSDTTAHMEPPGGTAGPLAEARHARTGDTGVFHFLGQPAGFPLRDHILMVSCGVTQSVDNIEEPTMILVAGWDPHEIKSPNEEIRQTGCLVSIYPATNYETLKARIGSVDLGPQHGT